MASNSDEIKPAAEEEEASKEAMVVLKSSDGELFEVEESLAKESVMVKNWLNDLGGDSSEPVPLFDNVPAKALAFIVEYLRKSRQLKAAGAGKAEKNEFFKEMAGAVDITEIMQLTLSANYLELKELLDDLCQSVADRIANKSVRYVRELFKIEDDFSPEEWEEVWKENAWASEGIED